MWNQDIVFVFSASLPQKNENILLSSKYKDHDYFAFFCHIVLCLRQAVAHKALNGKRRIVGEQIPSACCSQSKGMCPALLMLSLNGADKRACLHKYRRRAGVPTHSENVVQITRHEDDQSVSDQGEKKEKRIWHLCRLSRSREHLLSLKRICEGGNLLELVLGGGRLKG